MCRNLAACPSGCDEFCFVAVKLDFYFHLGKYFSLKMLLRMAGRPFFATFATLSEQINLNISYSP